MLTHEALTRDIQSCRPAAGQCAFWWLGQMSFVVRTGHHTLYFDPFLTERSDRLVPPLLRADEIADADLVFGSHDHDDHIDRPAWPEIAKASPKAKFVLPGGLKQRISTELAIPEARLVGLNDGETARVDGVSVSAIAAAHELLNDRNENEIFVVRTDGLTLVHTGDTCVYDGLTAKLKAVGDIDILVLPINGRDGRRLRRNCIGNMTYQEAVDLVGALRPRLAIPGHYEMFEGNTENPAAFAYYLEMKYPERDFWIGPHGQRVLWPLS